MSSTMDEPPPLQIKEKIVLRTNGIINATKVLRELPAGDDVTTEWAEGLVFVADACMVAIPSLPGSRRQLVEAMFAFAVECSKRETAWSTFLADPPVMTALRELISQQSMAETFKDAEPISNAVQELICELRELMREDDGASAHESASSGETPDTMSQVDGTAPSRRQSDALTERSADGVSVVTEEDKVEHDAGDKISAGSDKDKDESELSIEEQDGSFELSRDSFGTSNSIASPQPQVDYPRRRSAWQSDRALLNCNAHGNLTDDGRRFCLFTGRSGGQCFVIQQGPLDDSPKRTEETAARACETLFPARGTGTVIATLLDLFVDPILKDFPINHLIHLLLTDATEALNIYTNKQKPLFVYDVIQYILHIALKTPISTDDEIQANTCMNEGCLNLQAVAVALAVRVLTADEYLALFKWAQRIVLVYGGTSLSPTSGTHGAQLAIGLGLLSGAQGLDDLKKGDHVMNFGGEYGVSSEVFVKGRLWAGMWAVDDLEECRDGATGDFDATLFHFLDPKNDKFPCPAPADLADCGPRITITVGGTSNKVVDFVRRIFGGRGKGDKEKKDKKGSSKSVVEGGHKHRTRSKAAGQGA